MEVNESDKRESVVAEQVTLNEQPQTSLEEQTRSEAPGCDEGMVADQDAPVLIEEAVVEEPPPAETSIALKAVVEGAIYITDEPLSAEQIAIAVEQPLPRVLEILQQLVMEYEAQDRGLCVREVAGGYKMSTKPEYHEPLRQFVKNLQPPARLSAAAVETLAVIAYKQPITGPEILEIRGVQGAGVLKTLLDRKLIATAGRKNVLGKPMMYKTTREFLVHFGLNSLADLPTLKEFEELGRMALGEEDVSTLEPPAAIEERPFTLGEEPDEAEASNTAVADTEQRHV